jgi:hypothetical protein
MGSPTKVGFLLVNALHAWQKKKKKKRTCGMQLNVIGIMRVHPCPTVRLVHAFLLRISAGHVQRHPRSSSIDCRPHNLWSVITGGAREHFWIHHRIDMVMVPDGVPQGLEDDDNGAFATSKTANRRENVIRDDPRSATPVSLFIEWLAYSIRR